MVEVQGPDKRKVQQEEQEKARAQLGGHLKSSFLCRCHPYELIVSRLLTALEEISTALSFEVQDQAKTKVQQEEKEQARAQLDEHQLDEHIDRPSSSNGLLRGRSCPIGRILLPGSDQDVSRFLSRGAPILLLGTAGLLLGTAGLL
jgi:hypothetical protein